MNISGFDQCAAFINSQAHRQGPIEHEKDGRIHGVTISRESGCGAHTFAAVLAGYLATLNGPDDRPWTVFDRDLVEAVLRDHHLPARLASYLPEDRVNQVHDTIEHLFGLHPPTETMVKQAAQTILHLAQLGNVIIVGRGGNVITAGLPWMFHIRLTGSLDARIGHMQHFDHLDRRAALERIKQEDGGRKRYLRRYFGKDVADALLYDLVINTDRMSLENAARMAGTYIVNHKVGEAMAVR